MYTILILMCDYKVSYNLTMIWVSIGAVCFNFNCLNHSWGIGSPGNALIYAGFVSDKNNYSTSRIVFPPIGGLIV